MGKSVVVLLCGLVSVILVYAFLMSAAIRVVPETQRLVIFRLGRFLGVRGPGLVMVIPGIDRSVKIDLREQERTLPGESILTGDRFPVTVETRWHYKIIDPEASLLKVGSYERAAQELIAASLRDIIGKLNISDVQAKRLAIAEGVRSRLYEVAGKWGIQTTKVEVTGITLPRESQEAVQRGRTRQAALLGTIGEAKSPVYTEGTIELYGEEWTATSTRPIAPGKKVRVSGVVLEVEEL